VLGISKKGDAYARCLFIHGARAMLQMTRRRAEALSLRGMRIVGNRHPNLYGLLFVCKHVACQASE
jgi:transposase